MVVVGEEDDDVVWVKGMVFLVGSCVVHSL